MNLWPFGLLSSLDDLHYKRLCAPTANVVFDNRRYSRTHSYIQCTSWDLMIVFDKSHTIRDFSEKLDLNYSYLCVLSPSVVFDNACCSRQPSHISCIFWASMTVLDKTRKEKSLHDLPAAILPLACSLGRNSFCSAKDTKQFSLCPFIQCFVWQSELQ